MRRHDAACAFRCSFRGAGSRHPFQLGTERPTAGVQMSSKTGRSCLLLTSSCRIAFGVGLRVDVSIFVTFVRVSWKSRPCV